MPSKIRVLDEHTINKIAAGEVIENPASVVKELVENSMDAGATEICVEIKGGGRQLIRITDNGSGMNSDDALLCFERHATSKIKELEDIHSIFTMGFRGEAVPSIASISKFTLMTCPKLEGNVEVNGTMVIVDGGKIVQCCPISRAPGTTIEVKSLFFNVPVRKKFQKSPTYDANEILKVLNCMALGNPTIKFELISDQKTYLKTLPEQVIDFQNTLKHRVNEILGNEYSSLTFPVEIKQGDYSLQGLVGAPEYTRPNRTGQFLFINRRAVVSPLVSFAIRDGFGSSLPSNRHPVFVLHLTMPGTLVDVNVHPQKREVRLRHELVLKEMLMKAVRNGLQCSGPTLLTSQLNDFPPPSLESFDSPQLFTNKFNSSFFDTSFSHEPTILPQRPERTMFSENPPLPPTATSMVTPNLFPQPHPSKLPPRVLSTIKNYIITEPFANKNEEPAEDGFCVVDQRAAHSRIIFERLLQKKNPVSLQTLLIPFTFECTPMESRILLDQLEQLQCLGLHLRQSGPNSFLIETIPVIFGNTDMQTFISEMISSISENGYHKVVKAEQERQIALAASRAAVSQKRRLTIEEAQSLINQLMQCENHFQCPQGKPALIFINSAEMSKRFQK